MQIAIDIDDDIIYSINEPKDNLTALAKKRFVLELYKLEKISTSQGAKILEMDILDFMQLVSSENIPVLDEDLNLDIAREIVNDNRR